MYLPPVRSGLIDLYQFEHWEASASPPTMLARLRVDLLPLGRPTRNILRFCTGFLRGVEALNGPVSEPVWKTKPSWYLVAFDDKMIPPPVQRFISKRAGSTIIEGAGSHVIYVSQPDTVAALIEQAIKGV